eukprot:tig00021532_g22184.t1
MSKPPFAPVYKGPAGAVVGTARISGLFVDITVLGVPISGINPEFPIIIEIPYAQGVERPTKQQYLLFWNVTSESWEPCDPYGTGLNMAIFFKDGTYYARGRCTHLTTFTVGEIELNTFKSNVPALGSAIGNGNIAPPDHETSKSNNSQVRVRRRPPLSDAPVFEPGPGAAQLAFILPLAFGIGGVALLLTGLAVAKAKGVLPSWGPKSSSPYTPYSGPEPGAGAGAGGNPFNPPRNVGAFPSPDQPGGTTVTWSKPETASSNPPSQKLGSVPADRLSYTLPAALAGVPIIVRAVDPGGRFADAPPVSPDPAGAPAALLPGRSTRATSAPCPPASPPRRARPGPVLTWSPPEAASSGAEPVAQYQVWAADPAGRPSTLLGTVPGDALSYVLPTAAGAVGGAFVVRALGKSGRSGESGPISGRPAAVDAAAAPARDAPSNLQLTSVTSGMLGGTSGRLSWGRPAAGNPAQYLVLQDGKPLEGVAGDRTSAPVSDLPRDRPAVFQVVPLDERGAAGTPSYPLTAGLASDPSSGINLTAAPANRDASSALLAWSAPSAAAAAGLAAYSVLADGREIARVPATGAGTTSYVARGLPRGYETRFSVVPLSSLGGPAGPASDVVPLSLAPGSPASTAPTDLQLTNVSTGMMGGNSGTLSWAPPKSGPVQSFVVLHDGRVAGQVPARESSLALTNLDDRDTSVFSVIPIYANSVAGVASAPLYAGIPANPGAGITLTAAPASGSSARLSWNRPRGGGAYGPISQYGVLRNGQQIATVPASGADMNTFVASGLQPNSTSVYSVVPLSPSGSPSGPGSANVPVQAPLSSYGFDGAGTPFAGRGGVAPSPPSNLQLTGISAGGMGGASGTLSWSRPASGAPESYQILMNGAPAGSVSGGKTSVTVSDLLVGGITSLSVVPVGAGGVRGAESAPLVAGIPSDAGSGIALTAAAAGASSARLAWTRPRGGAYGPISQYAVFSNGQQIATVPASSSALTTFTANNVQPGAAFSVVPLTAAGEASGPGSLDVPLSGSGGAGLGAPSAPSNLQLTGVDSGLMGGTSGTLSWSHPASGAVESYQVLMNGAAVGTVSGGKTSMSVSDLPRGGVANLSVVPIGAGGVRGAASTPLYAGIPSDLGAGIVLTAAAAGASSARLAWTRPRGGASGSVYQYGVLRNGQQIATVPASGAETNVFTATGVQPGSAFSIVPLSATGSPSGPGSVEVPLSMTGGGRQTFTSGSFY